MPRIFSTPACLDARRRSQDSRGRAYALAASLLAMVGSPSVHAAAPTPTPDDARTPQPTSAADPAASRGRTRTGRDRAAAPRRIALDEEFLVEGELEKPSAYYILKRSRAEHDWARLDAKFLPLVLESVQDPLF